MSVRLETSTLARLAGPVIAGNLGMMAMGVVDTLMVARLGEQALAAATLGNIWTFGTLLPACGVLLGVDPIITQAHGRRDGVRCGLALQQALVLAVPLSLIVWALWTLARPILLASGQDEGLATTAAAYVSVQAWSILPMLGHWALRQYMAGRGIVAPAMWVAWIANIVNVVANWALIYGHLGFEAHGVLGAGIATGVSRGFMGLALLAWMLAFALQRGAWGGWSRRAFAGAGLAEILRHGVPSGGQLALEVWGFSLTGLMAGRLGATALAAHSIALNLASLAFMVPMGISIAAATRVGNLTGSGDEQGAARAARVALALGAGVMGLSALAFLLGRHALPALYGAEPAVLAAAAGILPIAAAFQIFDGTQVVGCGVLRGRGDTQPAFWFNLIGYYGLGLPCAWLLAFRWGAGLPGLWWGLLLGLGAVAVLLSVRILRRH